MAVTHVIAAAVAILLVMTSSPCDAESKDIKVPYYNEATLRCHENMTSFPSHKVFWITPGASVIDENTQMSDFPKNVRLVNNTLTILNVSKVDDDQFGYYTCVMVDNTSSKKVTLMRWGLNVDGADFSELEKQYRDSAIIGAIAAGVMLVVVGGACVIWNYRYSKRAGSNSERSSSIEDDLKKPSAHMYANQGYDSHAVTAADIEMMETPDEKANGSAAVTDGADGQENGGAQSFRM